MESIKTKRVQGLLEGELPLIIGFGTIHSVLQSQNSFSQGHYSRKPSTCLRSLARKSGPLGTASWVCHQLSTFPSDQLFTYKDRLHLAP